MTPVAEAEPTVKENDTVFSSMVNDVTESEVTVKADQSSHLLEERENSSIQDTSKTFMESGNPLLDEKLEQGLIPKLSDNALDEEELLLGDLEGQMNSFVMHNKDHLDRLKSVRLSKGVDIKSNSILSKLVSTEPENPYNAGNEFEMKEGEQRRKSTIPNEESYLKDLEA